MNWTKVYTEKKFTKCKLFKKIVCTKFTWFTQSLVQICTQFASQPEFCWGKNSGWEEGKLSANQYKLNINKESFIYVSLLRVNFFRHK